MYCTLVGRRIVVLHSFVKKTDKIPASEMAIAQKRLTEVKGRN
jgi:phage-related protein